MSREALGPLREGGAVVVIGAGPGGAACAIALQNLAARAGRRVRVVLYEGKVFAGGTHYNQCAGVLSPPIVSILEKDLGVPFPRHLVQRVITGYVLHSAHREILLPERGEPTYAVRRVHFDEYMLEQARQRGVEVVQSRVTDLEVTDRGVEVYSESRHSRADVVVGAFGMDDGTARIFERATRYRQPPFLASMVSKVHPGEEWMAGFGDDIHAFLPPIRGVEFGAVTPKGNHLTINIAGRGVNSALMDQFLQFPMVRAVLPAGARPEASRPAYFKGRFPLGLARGFYGDRYVLVGDAAGLLRPFKGKGVNTSMVTALRAARAIMLHGISAADFERHYRGRCREIVRDVPYGRLLRRLAILAAHSRLLDAALELAGSREETLREALFHSVSADRTFRRIFREAWSMGLLARVLLRSCRRPA